MNPTLKEKKLASMQFSELTTAKKTLFSSSAQLLTKPKELKRTLFEEMSHDLLSFEELIKREKEKELKETSHKNKAKDNNENDQKEELNQEDNTNQKHKITQKEEVNSFQPTFSNYRDSNTPPSTNVTNKPPPGRRVGVKRRHKKKMQGTRLPSPALHETEEALADLKLNELKQSHSGSLVYSPPPRFSSPCEKRPRSCRIDRPTPYFYIPESCKLTILPVDYPVTLLTRGQAEEIREQLMSKLDELDIIKGLHPEFTGYGFKSGACILTCDSQASKDWLVKCIETIFVNGDVKLKIGGIKDIFENIKVGVYLPGMKISKDQIIKRLTVQNPHVPEMEKWIVIGGKEDRKGFFGVLRIPSRSFEFLEKQNLQISYGMSKVRLKYLERKGGPIPIRKKGFYKGKRSNKFIWTPKSASQPCNESSHYEETHSDSKNKNNRWERGTACESLNYSQLDNSRFEQEAFLEPNDNSLDLHNNRAAGSRPEKEDGWGLDNHGEYSKSTPQRSGTFETYIKTKPIGIGPEKGTVCEPIRDINGRPERGPRWGSDQPTASSARMRSELESNTGPSPCERLQTRTRWVSDGTIGPSSGIRPERRDEWSSDKTTAPSAIMRPEWGSDKSAGLDGMRSGIATGWESDQTSGISNMRLKKETGWRSDLATGYGSTEPERGLKCESSEQVWPSKIKHKNSQDRYSVYEDDSDILITQKGYQRNSIYHDKPPRKIPGSRGAWGSGNHGNSAKTMCGRHDNRASNDHSTLPTITQESNRRELTNPANNNWMTKHNRVGGGLEYSESSRTASTRPEIIGWNSANTITERADGWETINQNRPRATPETSNQELDYLSPPTRAIPNGGWDPGNHNRPPGITPDNGVWETRNQNKSPGTTADKSEFEPGNHYISAMAINDKSGWEQRYNNRAPRTIPETSEWESDYGSRPQKAILKKSGWEPGNQNKPLQTIPDNSGWDRGNHNRPPGIIPDNQNRPPRSIPVTGGWDEDNYNRPPRTVAGTDRWEPDFLKRPSPRISTREPDHAYSPPATSRREKDHLYRFPGTSTREPDHPYRPPPGINSREPDHPYRPPGINSREPDHPYRPPPGINSREPPPGISTREPPPGISTREPSPGISSRDPPPEMNTNVGDHPHQSPSGTITWEPDRPYQTQGTSTGEQDNPYRPLPVKNTKELDHPYRPHEKGTRGPDYPFRLTRTITWEPDHPYRPPPGTSTRVTDHTNRPPTRISSRETDYRYQPPSGISTREPDQCSRPPRTILHKSEWGPRNQHIPSGTILNYRRWQPGFHFRTPGTISDNSGWEPGNEYRPPCTIPDNSRYPRGNHNIPPRIALP